ncbi:MAG: hypothetical protein K6E85_01105 [Lachnospiraceae bacterium]|nr:hypothetical protein [Lachnospiraceae bacterium]
MANFSGFSGAGFGAGSGFDSGSGSDPGSGFGSNSGFFTVPDDDSSGYGWASEPIMNLDEAREFLCNITRKKLYRKLHIQLDCEEISQLTLSVEVNDEYERRYETLAMFGSVSPFEEEDDDIADCEDDDGSEDPDVDACEGGVTSTCKMSIYCGPLAMALLLGEEETARKILDMLDEGEIEEQPMVTFADLCLDDNRNTPLTLESFLYNANKPMSAELREAIINKIEEACPEAHAFNYQAVKQIDKPVVHKMLRMDLKRHPKLFRGVQLIYQTDFKTLRFPVRLFMKNESMLFMIIRGIGANVMPKIKLRDSEIDKSEFMYFVEISEAYKGSEELRNAFFEFCIKLFITNLRIYCFNPFEDGNHSWNEKEFSSMMGMIRAFAPSAEKFQEMLDSECQVSNDKIYIYKIGRIIYGRNFDLLLNDDCDREINILGGLFGTDNIPDDYFSFGYNEMNAAEWFEFVGNIRRIRTRSGAPLDRKKVVKMMQDDHNKLKDIFLLMLEKGLLDGADIGYILRKAIENEECRYMIPMLMLCKEGALRNHG